MKRLIPIVLFLALVPVLMIQAQGDNPRMVIDEPVFTAGEVYRTGEKLEHAFIIKNTGTAELKILSAKPG